MGEEKPWAGEEFVGVAYGWARAVYHPPELGQDLVRLLAEWLAAASEVGLLPADLPHVVVTRAAVDALRARDQRRREPDEDALYY